MVFPILLIDLFSLGGLSCKAFAANLTGKAGRLTVNSLLVSLQSFLERESLVVKFAKCISLCFLGSGSSGKPAAKSDWLDGRWLYWWLVSFHVFRLDVFPVTMFTAYLTGKGGRLAMSILLAPVQTSLGRESHVTRNAQIPLWLREVNGALFMYNL